MSDRGDAADKAVIAYRAAGIIFMVAAIVFIFRDSTALWVSLFTLGIVFITLSTTVGRKPAEDVAAGEPEEPRDRPGE